MFYILKITSYDQQEDLVITEFPKELSNKISPDEFEKFLLFLNPNIKFIGVTDNINFRKEFDTRELDITYAFSSGVGHFFENKIYEEICNSQDKVISFIIDDEDDKNIDDKYYFYTLSEKGINLFKNFKKELLLFYFENLILHYQQQLRIYDVLLFCLAKNGKFPESSEEIYATITEEIIGGGNDEKIYVKKNPHAECFIYEIY